MLKIRFSIFLEQFRARSAYKFPRSANMTLKIFFFFNYFDVRTKNAEFDAEFESVEIVAKKFTLRKLEE